MSIALIENNLISIIQEQLRASETYKMTIQTGQEIGEEIEKTSINLSSSYIQEKLKEYLPLIAGVSLIFYLVVKK